MSMNKEILDKLEIFLKAYSDIYGDTMFVDNERISKLKNQLPEFRIIKTVPREKPKVIHKDQSPSPEKPDSPLWNYMREIQNCTRCPLHKSRTKFVFGDGNEHADIMFIGEAPGADEDRTGIPFVGRAGQLLNKLLAHIKLRREDVFIANILKSRPPNNRDPQPDEVAACIPYLHKQIELIQPKLIVALGRIAAQNLLSTTSSLKQMRGRVWQYQGVDMVVTYHPAAILRNANFMEASLEDFRFIQQRYHKIVEQQN